LVAADGYSKGKVQHPTATTNSSVSSNRSRRYTDVGHDPIEDKAGCIAIFSDAGQSPVAEEAVETAIQRPTRILIVSVGRVHEVPRERINVRVSQ
jgi:hypothetical protein